MTGHQAPDPLAGALVNDGRRDASFLDIVAERGRLAIWRRSATTGQPTLAYEDALATRC